MKNLKLIRSHCYDLWRDELKGARCISVDYDTGHVYIVTSSQLVTVDPNSVEVRINV